jgi:sugar-specific transcriptional regulator TrmB
LSNNKPFIENEGGELLILNDLLKKLGLTGRAAAIYLFLLKKQKPQNARDITKAIRTNKALVYRILKELQANGFIVSTMTFPTSFTAVPLDFILDTTVQSKKREVELLKEDKKLLPDAIKSLEIEEAPESDEFAILKNKHFAYMKGVEIIKQTEIECLVMSDRLKRLDYDVVEDLDKIVTTSLKKKDAKLKLIVNLDYETLDMAKDIIKMVGPNKKYIQLRHLDLSQNLFPVFALSDEKAILLQFDTLKGTNTNTAMSMDKMLWTNNKVIIRMAKVLFYKLWDESIDIQDKITQLERGLTANKESVLTPNKKSIRQRLIKL